MANRLKFRIRLTKRRKVLIRSIVVPIVVCLICFCAGVFGTTFLIARSHPVNIVWPADKTVNVPSDLRNFLLKQNVCNDYLGKDTKRGVGLWGVYQISQDKFAKISYGCSLTLTNYAMAIKQKGGWSFIPPAEYFSSFADTQKTGALPLCSQLEKYKIDKTVESFCIDANGTAKANEL